jgi:hypothetical protein
VGALAANERSISGESDEAAVSCGVAGSSERILESSTKRSLLWEAPFKIRSQHISLIFNLTINGTQWGPEKGQITYHRVDHAVPFFGCR